MGNVATVAIVVAYSLLVAAIIVRFAPRGPERSDEFILHILRGNLRFFLIAAPLLAVGFGLAYLFQ